MAKTFNDLFRVNLRDLYDAEMRIAKALPKMARAASSPELRQAFEDHFDETEEHITRLERAFDMLEEEPKRKKCEGIIGLLEEGEEAMKEDLLPSVKDAGLIAAAQKVEHYEMAGYGTVRTWASLMDHDGVASLLEQTLKEETATDELLTGIADELNTEGMEESAEMAVAAQGNNEERGSFFLKGR